MYSHSLACMELFMHLLGFKRVEGNISLTRNRLYFNLFYLVDRSGNHESKEAQEICNSFPLRYPIILKYF